MRVFMNKVGFFHDHIFNRLNNKYYSPGKMGYDNLSFYLKFFDSVEVVSRYKEVSEIGIDYALSSGPNVNINGVAGPLTKSGILRRNSLTKFIKSKVNECDYIIVRLPSEIGLIALKYSLSINKKTAVEVVANAHDCIASQGTLLSYLYANVAEIRNRRLIKKSKNVIYVTREYLQKKYPCKKNVVSATDAVINPACVHGIKSQLNTPIKIGFIGNPSYKLKGFKYLYDAVVQLNSAGYEVYLEVVGNKLDLSSEYNHQNLTFKGIIADRENIFTWLNSLDVYVQPSLTEGLPRSMLEAISMGKPCIGSNVGGMSELVHPSALVPAKDTMAIVNKIISIVEDSEYHKMLVKHSINLSQEYSYEKVSKVRNDFYGDYSSWL